MTRRFCLLAMAMIASTNATAEDMRFASFSAERLEWQFDADRLLFDLEGMYGSDEHRFVVKLEGDKTRRHDVEYSAQFLYNKPISPFFDLLLGVELLGDEGETTSGISVGFEGMAPQRIELDTHATITEDGDILFHGEFERAFLMTQKLVLLPRIEVSAALTDVGTIDAGFSEFEFEIRAHYEVTRKFAPYIGLSWQRVLGDSGRLLRLAGEDTNDTVVLLGASFWF